MQRDVDVLLADRETLFPGELSLNPCLRQWLGQVALDQDIQLEFSRKVSAGRVSQYRPSLGFVERVPHHLGRCLARLQHYGAGFDDAPVQRFFKAIGTTWADLLIHGIELGGVSAEETRIKLHVRFANRPEIERALLDHPDRHPDLHRFASRLTCHTAGFDLFHGGVTRMRNYVSFPRPRLALGLLERELGSEIAQVLAQAEGVWITWKDQTGDPFVYAVDADATRYVRLFDVQGVNPEHLFHRRQPAYIFGAPLSQWRARVLSDYNAYFMLR